MFVRGLDVCIMKGSYKTECSSNAYISLTVTSLSSLRPKPSVSKVLINTVSRHRKFRAFSTSPAQAKREW